MIPCATDLTDLRIKYDQKDRLRDIYFDIMTHANSSIFNPPVPGNEWICDMAELTLTILTASGLIDEDSEFFSAGANYHYHILVMFFLFYK